MVEVCKARINQSRAISDHLAYSEPLQIMVGECVLPVVSDPNLAHITDYIWAQLRCCRAFRFCNLITLCQPGPAGLVDWMKALASIDDNVNPIKTLKQSPTSSCRRELCVLISEGNHNWITCPFASALIPYFDLEAFNLEKEEIKDIPGNIPYRRVAQK